MEVWDDDIVFSESVAVDYGKRSEITTATRSGMVLSGPDRVGALLRVGYSR